MRQREGGADSRILVWWGRGDRGPQTWHRERETLRTLTSRGRDGGSESLREMEKLRDRKTERGRGERERNGVNKGE